MSRIKMFINNRKTNEYSFEFSSIFYLKIKNIVSTNNLPT